MEPTFIQWLISATGTTGLAGFAIYLLNEARKDMQAAVTGYAAANREDKLLLLKALDDSSKALTISNTKLDTILSLAQKREDWITNEQRNRATKGS